jgi:hypothetical protein
MLKENNTRLERNPDRENDNLDRGAIEDVLNSDNSFSDKGLNNDRLTRESMKKSNSYR